MSKFNFTKDSNFHDVFGDYCSAYTEEERRQRWEAYKKVIGKSMADFWSTHEGCEGCVHLDSKSSWCKDMGLPCQVSSFWGFTALGMACSGAGYKAEQPELNLFEQPF